MEASIFILFSFWGSLRAHRFARQVRSGKKIEDMDMFGATQIVAGAGVSNAGRPRLPTRLMISLLYLKHTFNESDEDVVQRWGETRCALRATTSGGCCA